MAHRSAAAGTTCGSAVACGATGGYETCVSGDGCRILTSDGNIFACPSCGDCRAQLVAAGAWCQALTAVQRSPGSALDMAPAIAQSKACSQWLACAAQYVPSEFPSLSAAYGAGGTCWKGDAALASSCTISCMTSLSAAEMNVNSPDACRP